MQGTGRDQQGGSAMGGLLATCCVWWAMQVGLSGVVCLNVQMLWSAKCMCAVAWTLY
jgi:hypothetical protein